MIKSRIRRAAGLALITLTGACGLLDVNDPTALQESDIGNPMGANLLRAHAVTRMYNGAIHGAWFSALVSDEMSAIPSQNVLSTGSVWGPHLMDRRDIRSFDGNFGSRAAYEAWQESRLAATHAINWYLEYGTAAQRPYLGQLRAAKGYTMVGLAEQVCSGFALHDFDGEKPVWGKPLTTDEVFARALVELDSAVVATADSARFHHFAKVTRGRALLGLGQFEEAAKAVEGVPTEFVLNGEYGPSPATPNRMRYTFSRTGNNQSVSDNEGGNGLDFISANDPRVVTEVLGTAHNGATLYITTKYKETTAQMTISSGIEARLIEAEAALRRNDPSWLTILNDLRSHAVAPAGLDPLVDPVDPDARVDLLFRERAFWLFGTGHRLGDLRRLVKHYGRDAESVFPSGAYHLGGQYGTSTSLGFSITGEEAANTGVTGCID